MDNNTKIAHLSNLAASKQRSKLFHNISSISCLQTWPVLLPGSLNLFFFSSRYWLKYKHYKNTLCEQQLLQVKDNGKRPTDGQQCVPDPVLVKFEMIHEYIIIDFMLGKCGLSHFIWNKMFIL